MNVVALIGNLTRDPELKYTKSDIPVTSFTVAVNRPTKDDEADFVRCVAWRKQAENITKYQGKGDKVGVEGRLSVRSYEDSEGVRKTVMEVIANRVEFLGGKGSPKEEEESPIEDDDVPF